MRIFERPDTGWQALLRVADKLGYSEEDLRRVLERTGKWPTHPQLYAAHDRRVIRILNESTP